MFYVTRLTAYMQLLANLRWISQVHAYKRSGLGHKTWGLIGLNANIWEEQEIQGPAIG